MPNGRPSPQANGYHAVVSSTVAVRGALIDDSFSATATTTRLLTASPRMPRQSMLGDSPGGPIKMAAGRPYASKKRWNPRKVGQSISSPDGGQQSAGGLRAFFHKVFERP